MPEGGHSIPRCSAASTTGIASSPLAGPLAGPTQVGPGCIPGLACPWGGFVCRLLCFPVGFSSRVFSSSSLCVVVHPFFCVLRCFSSSEASYGASHDASHDDLACESPDGSFALLTVFCLPVLSLLLVLVLFLVFCLVVRLTCKLLLCLMCPPHAVSHVLSDAFAW